MIGVDKVIYKMMIPPIEVGNFDELSKKQAEEHFKWYVDEIPFRLNQLEEYANAVMNANLVFDKKPSSLVTIWEWFESIMVTEKKTEKEINKEFEMYPQWLHNRILENDIKFTIDTLVVGMDIAIYFGETFIRNNPTIKWGYFTKPRKRASVNRPVLLGFVGQQDLDPREIILNCMRKSLRGKNPNLLLNLYNIWIDEIKK